MEYKGYVTINELWEITEKLFHWVQKKKKKISKHKICVLMSYEYK